MRNIWLVIGALTTALAVSGLLFVVSEKGTRQAVEEGVKAQKEEQGRRITIGITPHHLLAQRQITEGLKAYKSQAGSEIERVIIIAPNHFQVPGGEVSIKATPYTTSNQTLTIDTTTIEQLQKIEGAYQQEDIFIKEHGIYALLPSIQKIVPPQTPIVPMIVNQKIKEKTIQEIVKTIAKQKGTTLVLLSMDSSHELNDQISQFHDQKTIEYLKALDQEKIENADIDNPAGAKLIMELAKQTGQAAFHLIENANSSQITKKDQIGENTSYITGYYKKESTQAQQEKEKTTDILFAGDVMLDRQIRTMIEQNGAQSILKPIQRLFLSQDYNIWNLEGTVTDNPSVSRNTSQTQYEHFKFTFPPKETQTILKQVKISAVSLGNNHSNNFGKEGAEQTKQYLEESSVQYFGNPYNTEENTTTLAEAYYDDTDIELVSYNQFGGASLEQAVQQIQQASTQGRTVIVYTHWGQEYSTTIGLKEQEKARAFIDTGAEMVIGSHPHVVQPFEIYNNKFIAYSLGNMVFDQYFTKDVSQGLVLLTRFTKQQTEIQLVPIQRNKQGQISLATQQQRKEMQGHIAKQSEVSEKTKQQIQKGRITIKK